MTQHSCTPVCVHFMCNTFAWLLLKLKYCIWARMRYKILHHLWLKHRNMHLFLIRLQCQNIKGTIYSEMKHQIIKKYINNASLYVTINLNKSSREINAQKGKRVSHICHRKRMILLLSWVIRNEESDQVESLSNMKQLTCDKWLKLSIYVLAKSLLEKRFHISMKFNKPFTCGFFQIIIHLCVFKFLSLNSYSPVFHQLDILVLSDRVRSSKSIWMRWKS